MNRQRPQQPQQQARGPDFLTQLANFGKSIGLYGRFAIAVNILVFAAQKLLMSNSVTVALYFGFNYQSIVGAHQYYRFVTAAFSHQGFAHILFNMCALAVFSVNLESQYAPDTQGYGTIFFTALNVWLLLLCSSLQLLYGHARIFWLPESLGGEDIDVLVSYSYGYSAILFGLIMLFCLSGDKYMKVYGCQVRKIYLPFFYLILSSMIVPNADFFGHFSGIVAALILRYCGFYQLRLLPQQAWMQAVEKGYSERAKKVHEAIGYIYAKTQIEDDFACCKVDMVRVLRQRRHARMEQARNRMADSNLQTTSSDQSTIAAQDPGRFELRSMPIESNEERT